MYKIINDFDMALSKGQIGILDANPSFFDKSFQAVIHKWGSQ
jgi:hypothetical protein